MNVNTYIERKSLYHNYDGRAKILFTLELSVIIFLVPNWYGLLSALIFVLLLSITSVGLKETRKGFLRIMPILIFLVIFSPFQARDSEALIKIKNFTLITDKAFFILYKSAIRFIVISFLFFLLVETEKNEDLIRALKWYGLPYNASLTLSMVLRYIPYFISLYEEIKDSMSLRLKEGKRGVPVLPVITALVLHSITMIPKTASALEERGFGLKNRTETRSLPNNPIVFTEIFVSAILPLIFLGVIR